MEAMSTMAVAFANIYMAAIKRQILSQSSNHLSGSVTSTIYSLFGTSTDARKSNISLTDTVNRFHPMIEFTAENLRKGSHIILDMIVYKGASFNNQSILDVRTHFKAN